MFEMVQDPSVERTMAKTIVYFVNNAETNVQKNSITDKGKQQAHELFRSRLITGPEAIYSATPRPVIQTADIISSDFGIPSTMVECLSHIDLKFSGKSPSEYANRVEAFLQNREESIEAGISQREAESKLSECVNELAINHSGQSIVIVCDSIAFLLFHRLVVGGVIETEDWLNLGHCSCASYEYSKHGWALLLPPDNTYLTEPTVVSESISSE